MPAAPSPKPRTWLRLLRGSSAIGVIRRGAPRAVIMMRTYELVWLRRLRSAPPALAAA
jgi:hypothetical protein